MTHLVCLFTTLSVFICAIACLCFPLALNLRFDKETYNFEEMPILRSMRSTTYRDSLVASTAISIVLLIDVLFEGIFSASKMYIFYFLRVGILLGMMIPDSMTLFWVSQSLEPSALSLLLEFKAVSLYFFGLLILYFTKSNQFRSMIIPCLCMVIASVFRLWLSFSILNSRVVLIGFYLSYSASIILMCRAFILSYRTATYSIAGDITLEALISNVFISSLAIALIPKFIFLCIFGPAINASTTSFYLAVQTYGYLWFSITNWLRVGKVFREDAAHTKVSLNLRRIFVRYISHEIRSPLNTILMGMQFLKQSMLEKHYCVETSIEMINELEESCDAAIRILNDLIDYERLESGVLKLNKKKIDIWQFVIDSVRPFMRQARQAGILLTLWSEEDYRDYAVYGDIHKLRQVMRNFISNALKFTPSGGSVMIKVSICKQPTSTRISDVESSHFNPSLEKCGESKSYRRPSTGDLSKPMQVIIEVIDTGCGIALQNLPKIFNELEEFEAGELHHGDEFGLGMWISKSIVELHGGMVSVQSEGQGKGCTFSMELPVIVPELKTPLLTLNARSIRPDSDFFPSEAQLTTHRDEAPRSFTDLLLMSEQSVLVVDDVALNRKMLFRLIDDKFKSVIEARNGDEALQIVHDAMNKKGVPPDIILMDFVMPVMDGPTASKEMRALGYQGIIIGVTGNALPADIDMFLSHGANRVLIKPLKLEVLLKTITELNDTVI